MTPNWGSRKALNTSALEFVYRTRKDFPAGAWFIIAEMTNSGKFIRRPFSVRDIEKYVSSSQFGSDCNLYISANSFIGEKNESGRIITERVFSLNNLVVDIDCHSDCPSRDIQVENFIYAIRSCDCDYGILEPNLIVRTGRGVQLWWHHESLSVHRFAWTWDSVAKRLLACVNTVLRDLGPDIMTGCPNLSVDAGASCNPAGIYRLAGTMNAKSKTTSGFEVLSEHTYSLNELTAWRDTIPLPCSRGFTRPSGDIRQWCKFMAENIKNLRDERQAPVGDELRNNFCFCYYGMLTGSGIPKSAALDMVSLFNEGFRAPLSLGELQSTLSTCKKKQYLLSAKSVIELLNITKTEQTKYCIGVGSKTKKLAKEKAARKKAKEKRDKKIIALFQGGIHSMVEIGKRVGCGRQLVTKVLAANGIDRRMPEYCRRAEIVKLWKQGWTEPQIADKLSCCVRVIASAKAAYRQGDVDYFGPLFKEVFLCKDACTSDSNNDKYVINRDLGSVSWSWRSEYLQGVFPQKESWTFWGDTFARLRSCPPALPGCSTPGHFECGRSP